MAGHRQWITHLVPASIATIYIVFVARNQFDAHNVRRKEMDEERKAKAKEEGNK